VGAIAVEAEELMQAFREKVEKERRDKQAAIRSITKSENGAMWQLIDTKPADNIFIYS